ncbi:MAG: epoxyqueuosine reductase [Bacteroidales bacterium]|nr:epoxyqueuosine reductase [Bacteroidales bacterium]MBN2775660.1 epoxyqueuosine reductase [Prolixibacteraceae bacterium]
MIKEIVKSHLNPIEKYVVGFADLSGLIDKQFGDYVYGISIGRKLDDEIVDKIKEGPTLEYYNHYNEINKELFELSAAIANSLEKRNVKTKIIRPTVTTEELDTKYSDTLRTELSHKMVATRAGLGWIGKTDLLVTHIFGPRLRFTTILTNTPLETESKPIEKSLCGNCNICVTACPANAANGKKWNILTDRDEFFNARKCREKAKELAWEKLKTNVRICGICVAVCPIGTKKMAGGEAGLAN